MHVARAAFVSGMNEILVVGGIGALLAAAAAFALIRARDFAPPAPPPASPQASPAVPAAVPAADPARSG